MSRGTRPKQVKGANFQDMTTFRAITKEGATFCYDMFALRAEKISRGAKLFVSRRLFEWDVRMNLDKEFQVMGIIEFSITV